MCFIFQMQKAQMQNVFYEYALDWMVHSPLVQVPRPPEEKQRIYRPSSLRAVGVLKLSAQSPR